MVRAGRIAFVAGVLIVKAALAFVAMMMIATLIVPLPGPADPRIPGAGESTWSAGTFVLNLPEGEVSRTITVVDRTGRELASVTRFHGGSTALMGLGRDRTGVNCYLNNETGVVSVGVQGASRLTEFTVQPDGTTRTAVIDTPRDAPSPSGDTSFSSPLSSRAR